MVNSVVVMTELIYMKNCYVKEWNAVIEKVGKDDQGNFIVLDRSAFYPESGGQLTDTGFVEWDGQKAYVIKVTKRGLIKHYINGPEPPVGKKVHCVVDWKRRYALMKMHTAQHIISAVALKRFGSKTVGNQIHTDYSRLDLKPSKLSQTDLTFLEQKSNEIVDSAIPIEIYEVDRQEAESKPEEYRCNFSLLPKFIKKLRVVYIKGFDKAICAGTHVSNTKEVGHFKILKKENKGKNTERIIYELV